MFNFFRSKKKYEPLDYEGRKYFEKNLLWLMAQFPEPAIEKRKIITPTNEDFPIKWQGSEENAQSLLDIICTQMQIDTSDIALHFFERPSKEFYLNGDVLFAQNEPDVEEAAGLYHPEKIQGKNIIEIDSSLLKNPQQLIAVMAHELSHFKLLGQLQMEVNDEMLTDLATVFFGFGIFNANSAFQFINEYDRWGHDALGYLQIEEWAYALALFAFIRHEDEPIWKKYLNSTITPPFEKCLKYLLDNEEEIFKFEDH